MCGIIGIVGQGDVAPLILEALQRLEYRGYDSAGAATVVQGRIERRRAEGKIARLEEKLAADPLSGSIGIGHTRWATHGAPNAGNAHPHATDHVAVVHNGIIDNFAALRRELEAQGRRFETDTDTEVVPQLLTLHLEQGRTPEEAVRLTLARLEGAYALGILFAGREDMLAAARRGSPLAIGYGEGAMYLGSDALALAPFTSRIAYLEDGDVAFLTRTGATITDADGRGVERPIAQTSFANIQIGKENYRHFMHKEIHEQPTVLSDVLRVYSTPATGEMRLPDLPFSLEKVERVTLLACGTSYYAGMLARYWIERLARIPVDVEIASEFRYREPPLTPGGIACVISQSGETADALAALRYAKAQKQRTVAVVNVQESSLAREADAVLPIYSGPEIGVASTKAFTAQCLVLLCFAIALASARKSLSAEAVRTMTHTLSEIPARMAEILAQEDSIRELAQTLADVRDMIYIGRGTAYPIALEGALKLKEISYIHAEAVAAGELKHGPIALVDEHVPVIALAPRDALFEKTASNIREVAARGGKVVLLSDEDGIAALRDVTHASIRMPRADALIAPILYAVPVQLLAYHVAVCKGTDVDQPRNLAKSVTVE